MKVTPFTGVVSLSLKHDANGKPNFTVMVSPDETAPDGFVPEPFFCSTDSLEGGISQFRILAALAEHLLEQKMQKGIPEGPSVAQDPILGHPTESDLNFRRTLEMFMRRAGLNPDEGTTATKSI